MTGGRSGGYPRRAACTEPLRGPYPSKAPTPLRRAVVPRSISSLSCRVWAAVEPVERNKEGTARAGGVPRRPVLRRAILSRVMCPRSLRRTSYAGRRQSFAGEEQGRGRPGRILPPGLGRACEGPRPNRPCAMPSRPANLRRGFEGARPRFASWQSARRGVPPGLPPVTRFASRSDKA
jgi:hypothetical protein